MLESVLRIASIAEYQNIPKLYTALAEWMSCVTVVLIYRRFIDDTKIKKLAGKLVVSLLGLSLVQLWCGTISNWLWQVGMLSAVIIMGITIKSCMELSWSAAFYICSRAFIRAEFLASVEWQIYYFYFQSREKGNAIVSVVFCVILFGCGCGLFERLEESRLAENMDKGQLSVTLKQQGIIWFITVFIFEISNLSYIQINTPFTGNGITEIFNIRTLMDLAGVFMLEAFHMQKVDTDRKQEMMAIQNILSTHYAQYRESQDNMNLINQKYHDLKHQLQIIREESNDQKRKEYLDEIERDIHCYECEIKTGNSVLDTILTSKSNQCQNLGIVLTVVADGALLNHIHVMDLCTIFGNALDNAIEYEVQITEKEKRKIHVHITEKRELVCVVVENYYEGKKISQDELPETTKLDRRFHGYGLKSVRYSVNKYGGYMNMSIKDEWFRLEMLFHKNKECTKMSNVQ